MADILAIAATFAAIAGVLAVALHLLESRSNRRQDEEMRQEMRRKDTR